ncbi:hypothetical protein [Desulfobulbus propionicus]|jgi:hypothetical protein
MPVMARNKKEKNVGWRKAVWHGTCFIESNSSSLLSFSGLVQRESSRFFLSHAVR